MQVVSGRLRGVVDPGLIKLADDGAGSNGVRGYGFDDTRLEEILLFAQIPHSYREGSDLRFHLHWMKTTSDAGNVRWGLEYWISSPLGDFPANTVVIEQTSALLATDSKLGHQVCDFATHISGEGIGMSSVLNCRLYRDPTHADDTYGADAVALSADFHIEKDRRGSLKEWHQL